MEVNRFELTKTELELEITKIFKKEKILKRDLKRSRVLTKKYVEQTNYKSND
ncbi:hypothetical protein [uncultured Flavobacterium sp.]|uniref:hypothetical protein n=1 Tax=uncultured Flavobacterium sp. TaxID=165435 RepID=UPI0030EDBEFD|tara:strand:+ start:6752 stop:6907 length:156 start_codon:yes stop_codon:yes gene_type:complete